jgi:hypothetical protein
MAGIPEKYPKEAAVLFATGPSLNKKDIELVKEYHEKGLVRAFGCNDSYRVVNYLDVLYACDGQWWDHHYDKVKEMCSADLWTQELRVKKKHKEINYIPGKFDKKLSLNPNIIHFGANSGFQLLNVAYLMGIRKFILLGYNMGAGGGPAHFFGHHPKGVKKGPSPWPRFIQAFNSVQNDIAKNIINCTEPSALECYKKMKLEEALNIISREN